MTRLNAPCATEAVALGLQVVPVHRLRWGVATAFHTEEEVN